MSDRHRSFAAACLVLMMSASLAVPGSALAGPNFGTKTKTSLGAYQEGTLASIVVGNQAAASSEILLQRAVVQSDYGSVPGLAQTGTGLTAANIGLDACGVRTSPTAYTEFKQAGTSGAGSNYYCYWANAIGIGSQYDYRVCHYNSNFDNSWYTTLGGSLLQQSYLGFNSGYAAGGGEINNAVGTAATANGSSASATYRNFSWYNANLCSSPVVFSTQYTSYDNYYPSVSWSVTDPSGGTFYNAH